MQKNDSTPIAAGKVSVWKPIFPAKDPGRFIAYDHGRVIRLVGPRASEKMDVFKRLVLPERPEKDEEGKPMGPWPVSNGGYNGPVTFVQLEELIDQGRKVLVGVVRVSAQTGDTVCGVGLNTTQAVAEWSNRETAKIKAMAEVEATV